MQISSTSFKNHDKIPSRYAGTGEDVSPPLQWSGVPEGAKSLALICEDLDAPSNSGKKRFTHWVAYNIPPTLQYLHEGIQPKEELHTPQHFCQGPNSFGKIGYNGPNPPDEKTHRYVFTLYALDIEYLAGPGQDLNKVKETLKGHVLSSAELTGRFEKPDSRTHKKSKEKGADLNS